eukprot:8608659-Ditylum_brightwellii.AAC.1
MCHLAAIAPAVLGLFMLLNRALEIQKGRIGLGKKSEVRVAMEELAAILKKTASRLTNVQELARTLPLVAGY